MHTLIFDRHNISLEYENNCVIIRQPDIGPRSIPLRHVRKVMCVHSVQLSTSLLGQLWQRGIDFICLNNRYSERSFALIPNQQKQVSRRCLQYAWQQHEQQAAAQARREAEALAEKQREAELAAMSEEERSIVEITQRLNSGEGKGQGSGCQLATELAQLCEQASCWSDDLQLQLHAVAVQTCKHLDIDTKKNKKWKERLRNLKVGD